MNSSTPASLQADFTELQSNEAAITALIQQIVGTDPRLATVILNTYEASTVGELALGLDEMCAPTDRYGFSSSGIYVFWHPETKEVLYVGLAVDLPLRFRHHNNLTPCAANCCKWPQIQQHFRSYPKLGYTILAQSTLDQAVCDRWSAVNADQMERLMEELGYHSEDEAKSILNMQVDRNLRRTEGAILEVHVQDHGRLPAWNKIRGFDVNYSDQSLTDAREYLKAATGTTSLFDQLVAKSSLVEMAANSLWAGYEEYLHGIRFLVRGVGFTWDTAAAKVPDFLGYKKSMAQDGYIFRKPVL